MATKVVSPIDGNKLGDNSPKHGMMPGGITYIPDAEHNHHIKVLANLAVDEYNMEHGTSLEFKKVDYAASQVVSGVMYYIALEANEDFIKLYKAKVWEQPWNGSTKLVEFKEICP